MVDVAEEEEEGKGEEGPLHFRRVLAPQPSPASHLLVERRLGWMDPGLRTAMQAIEIAPQAMFYAQELAQRVQRHRGAALVVDYGRDGPYEASLQAIKDHRGVPFLSRPGEADLSAWVDFSALKAAIRDASIPAKVLGPVTQSAFLQSLGIGARLQMLLRGAKDDQQRQELNEGCQRLIATDGPGQSEGEAGMGSAYKVMAIVSSDLTDPVGFTPAAGATGTA